MPSMTKRVELLLLAVSLTLGLQVAQGLAEEPAARTFEMEENRLKLPAPILFQTGTDQLLPESDPALEHVAAYLKEKEYITTMRIEGHTDGDGDADKNQQLSGQRAMAVGRWLIKHGIACERLIAVGFGGTKPVASEESPEGKAANRRVWFVNAALRGRSIGRMPLDGGGLLAGDLCGK